MGNRLSQNDYEQIVDVKLVPLAENVTTLQHQQQQNDEKMITILNRQTQLDEKFNRLMEQLTKQQETNNVNISRLLDRLIKQDEKEKTQREQQAKHDELLSRSLEENAKIAQKCVELLCRLNTHDEKIEDLQRKIDEIFYGNNNLNDMLNQNDERDHREQTLHMVPMLP